MQGPLKEFSKCLNGDKEIINEIIKQEISKVAISFLMGFSAVK